MTQNIIRFSYKSWKTKRTESNKREENIFFVIYLLRKIIQCYISVRCKSMWIFAFSIWCDSLLLQQLKVKSLVNADQSCTITCRSFSPFLSAEPLKLCDVGGFPPMNCLRRSFRNILIGLRSGLWLSHSKTLTLFFFNQSLVEWLVCLGLLSCCMTPILLRLCS